MKTDRKLLIAGLGLTFFLLQGCGGGSSSTDYTSTTDTGNEEIPPAPIPAPIVLPTSYKADDGRLLGSQCAQCHGTNGVSTSGWDSIAGETDLLGEIEEIISQDEEPIMTAQAHGYTQEEIILIGDWLKTLPTND